MKWLLDQDIQKKNSYGIFAEPSFPGQLSGAQNKDYPIGIEDKSGPYCDTIVAHD